MKFPCRRVVLLSASLLLAIGMVSVLSAQPTDGGASMTENDHSNYIIEEAGPDVEGVLYQDGSTETYSTYTQWRPICGSDMSGITAEQFAEIVEGAKLAGQQAPAEDPAAPHGGGLDLVFSATSPPAGAQAALNAVEAYIEAQFGDNISVTISMSWANMGPGVLGATMSNYVNNVSFTTVRNALINGMDSDDTIQTALPTTMSVRYDGASSATSTQTTIDVPLAAYRAGIGSVGGAGGSMQFNTAFAWDYDPTNGIAAGTTCFRSVVAHEVAHALGFISNAECGAPNDMDILDIYRFQFTDGGANDYNPDTVAEFTARPRLVDCNVPNDDVVSDTISNEYRMSDGNPWQASHFREQVPVIGIMDPAMTSGQTFHPNYYMASDRNMLDAIGWDYPPVADLTPPTPNPMSFATPPTASSISTIFMIATTATDATNPPVEYFFDYQDVGGGGDDSAWQTGIVYNDTGLSENTLYSYCVRARDSAPSQNETTCSPVAAAATFISAPSALTTGTVTQTSVGLTVGGSLANLNVGSSGVLIEWLTDGGTTYAGDSGWIQTLSTTATGLNPNTAYTFRVKARNQTGTETAFSASANATTLPPAGAGGDCDGNGSFELNADTSCFVGVLLGLNGDPGAQSRSDLNGDSVANGLDVSFFVDCAISGCP